MTCVWEGILTGLKKHRLIDRNMNIDCFVQHIKSHNEIIDSVTFNGKEPTDKQKEENFERIENIGKIQSGYLCSSFDPLLFLICHLYKVNIIHNFNAVKLRYLHDESNITLHFESNKSHFWCKN
jgi:hypothetical protein